MNLNVIEMENLCTKESDFLQVIDDDVAISHNCCYLYKTSISLLFKIVQVTNSKYYYYYY
jgi:hypothetical protein